MKRLIIPIILLVLFVFAVPCMAGGLANLFKPETRAAVDSEIDPWDIFVMEGYKNKCLWTTEAVFICPSGDLDIHIIISNPDTEADISKIELVIADGGGFLPLGVLCSYSYMKDGEWYMFLYDHGKNRFIRYEGEGGHGGSVFGRKE